jgi:CheY-like chemotaxis protein
MAETLILGNNPDAFWIKGIDNKVCCEVIDLSINEVRAVSVYLERVVTSDVEKLVIDACSIDTDLALNIALQVRLMLHTFKKASLCGIIIVSDDDLELLSNRGVESVLLMTAGIDVCAPAEAELIVERSAPISAAEYVNGFLNLIKIEPMEKGEGRHSIANEWGADILNKTINTDNRITSDIISVKASSSLYFKYSSVVALNADKVGEIVDNKFNNYILQVQPIKKSFNYLLIDDEADKGWTKVLASLMPKAQATVYNKRAHDFSELPPEIQNEISVGKYDVIFLDLRMAGIEEEAYLKPEDFSGMKILKAIKAQNPGIQVIMLTATNKGWNVKALLDAGADGYYMKESPEYHFPIKYSEANALSLCDTIERCIANAYLSKIYSDIKALELPSDWAVSSEIKHQLQISFNLVNKAVTADEMAFAYIALAQVFEICTSNLIEEIRDDSNYVYKFTEEPREECYCYNTSAELQGTLARQQKDGRAAQWEKVSAVYYQLWEGANLKFADNARKFIDRRNAYIHPTKSKPKIGKSEYQDLFNLVVEFLSKAR